MSDLKQQALDYHEHPVPGKYAVKCIKPMATQKDLALAYSPGVAEPCLEIAKDEQLAYKYTRKGNMVAVITNGTAVLGLGNIGALAGKPVMEGKSVLFNKFAGVESIDLCLDCTDPEEFINAVKYMGPSFSGINLEDIKGPDCFYIEKKLKELMKIPVFHDDQHGTAIVCLAGLINALEITGKKVEDIKVVCNGAGAAGIACMKLLLSYGAKVENITLCDTRGVIYKGRGAGMNEYKEEFAQQDDSKKTLLEACTGADVLVGVSAAGAFTEEILLALNKDPIIFAMANPVPEVIPSVAKQIRPDCMIATGRSDYPNQINNVMCFPFLFRAALDTRSKEINEEMKMAAAKALAQLTHEDVPEEVKQAITGREFKFGPDYIIPTPFDPRLIERVPVEVAKAAISSGAATVEITDFVAYAEELKNRVRGN